MTVQDLIEVSSTSNYHVLIGSVHAFYDIDHVYQLLADYGRHRIYILSTPSPDTLELILHQDDDLTPDDDMTRKQAVASWVQNVMMPWPEFDYYQKKYEQLKILNPKKED